MNGLINKIVGGTSDQNYEHLESVATVYVNMLFVTLLYTTLVCVYNNFADV